MSKNPRISEGNYQLLLSEMGRHKVGESILSGVSFEGQVQRLYGLTSKVEGLRESFMRSSLSQENYERNEIPSQLLSFMAFFYPKEYFDVTSLGVRTVRDSFYAFEKIKNRRFPLSTTTAVIVGTVTVPLGYTLLKHFDHSFLGSVFLAIGCGSLAYSAVYTPPVVEKAKPFKEFIKLYTAARKIDLLLENMPGK